MRLSQIDDSNRDDHARLTPADQCYFLYEYTSGQTWAFSSTNSLISNLKKKPSLLDANQSYYKDRAIYDAASALRQTLNPNALQNVTLVPVPGSKAPGHPDYDPRMDRVCSLISSTIDIRNLVVQTDSTEAAHEAGDGDRITVQQLLDVYQIDEALVQPVPTTIWIMDDVLTAGTHFKAMQIILAQRFPEIPVFGVFIARRVFA